MSAVSYIIVASVIVLILKVAWNSRRRRPPEEGFRFVYVNQDGSVRELSESERIYLETDFEGGDGGRPYVKSGYKSYDGWGSISGFIQRSKVPSSVIIGGVVPTARPDDRVLMADTIVDAEAVGDVIKYGADGTVGITPNPMMSGKERFRELTERQLLRQREREDAMMNPVKKYPVEPDVDRRSR